MKEMIRKILDAIPENEIRKYLEEKDDLTTPLSRKEEIAKAKIKAERTKQYKEWLDEKIGKGTI